MLVNILPVQLCDHFWQSSYYRNIYFVHFRPSKPAPRPVVRKNDDYNPSVNRPSAAPSKRPDRDRGVDKGGRKPAGGPSNKPSRDPRQVDRGDRGRGQQRGDKDRGAAKKEHKVRVS